MTLPSPYAPPGPSNARCARHVQEAALATCTRCGSYACGTCLRYGNDGLQYCLPCVPGAQHALADRGARFLAKLVDNLVSGAVGIAAGVGGGLLAWGLMGGAASNADGFPVLIGFVVGALVALGLLTYNTVLEGRTGQTWGKRMLRIRVVASDGQPADFWKVVMLRSFLPGVIAQGCSLFGLADALMIFGEQQRCVHDVMADTIVVRAD